jgi:hypothetical protein
MGQPSSVESTTVGGGGRWWFPAPGSLEAQISPAWASTRAAGDGEAETAAAGVGGLGVAVEDAGELVGGDAGTGVGDGEDDRSCGGGIDEGPLTPGPSPEERGDCRAVSLPGL